MADTDIAFSAIDRDSGRRSQAWTSWEDPAAGDPAAGRPAERVRAAR